MGADACPARSWAYGIGPRSPGEAPEGPRRPIPNQEPAIHAHHRKKGRHRGRKRPERPAGAPRREHIEELHPTEEVPAVDSFREFDLGEQIQEAIAAMGITKPTPIQALSIGPVLAGRDVIAKAETGTGKTLAFGAPMMAKIDATRATVLGLVLCPTRELAQQVAEVLVKLGEPGGVQVALIVGGDPMHPQVNALKAGAQVVVGTPGRVLDLYQQRFLSFPWTEFVVLDEADKMFEIGFLDDIRKILSYTPEERNTLLFSATFPTEVLKLARNSTRDPLEVATAKGTATVDSIDQRFIAVDERDKALVLTRLLEQSADNETFLVFCERRTDVDQLMRRLERLRFPIKALHGGYDQDARFRVMSAYRTGEVKALLATDVAARGLDVDHVTHVVNFGVPREIEDYTHRIGRTGRAGREGTAITLVSDLDRRKWDAQMRRTKFEITEHEPPGRYKRGGDDSRARTRDRDDGRDRRRDESRRPRRDRDDERRPRRAKRDDPERGERKRDERGRDDRKRTERKRDERPREPRRKPEPAGAPQGFGAVAEPEAPAREEAPRRDDDRPKRRRRGGRGRADRGGDRARGDDAPERRPKSAPKPPQPPETKGPAPFGSGL
jgi:superfamily II DNA/RNA helicase